MIKFIIAIITLLLLQACSNTSNHRAHGSKTPTQGYISDLSKETLSVYKHDLPYNFNPQHPIYEFYRKGLYIENDFSKSIIFGWENAIPVPEKPDMWVKLKRTGELCIQNEIEEHCTKRFSLNHFIIDDYAKDKVEKKEPEKKEVFKKKVECRNVGSKRECIHFYDNGKIKIRNVQDFHL